MKVGLIYPPGKIFMRGEDRCQASIESSSATAMRACNDLGYAASVLRQSGHRPFLRDYQTERCSVQDVIWDIKAERIDVLCISTTNATVYEDIEFVKKIKSRFTKLKIILKGAIFYDPEIGLLDLLDLSQVDYLIGGEIEFCIKGIIDAIAGNRKPDNCDNILYKDGNTWVKTEFHVWNDNLDELPFPARDLMKNSLYVRPDTGEPMATIQTGRGCPSRCIYCLTPEISGRKIRKRSVENVYEEICECFYTYGLTNFFFKADTFTIDKEWTSALCDKIIDSELYGKIHFTANSRVNPLSKELMLKMKEAGCFMVAFGFETGSSRSMALIQKGASVEQNILAMKWAKEIGLPVYGFFMIGFPWEKQKDIVCTWKHILDIDPDFIEVSIAFPYYGTRLYNLCRKMGTLRDNLFGNDYFHAATKGTKYLSEEELISYRKRILLSFYMRPKYVFKKLKQAVKNPVVMKNYITYGVRMMKNMLR